jgi:hypothetical protein
LPTIFAAWLAARSAELVVEPEDAVGVLAQPARARMVKAIKALTGQMLP